LLAGMEQKLADASARFERMLQSCLEKTSRLEDHHPVHVLGGSSEELPLGPDYGCEQPKTVHCE